MDRRDFLRTSAVVGVAALLPGRATAAIGGLERALHEPIALARVNAGARVDELFTFDLTEHGRDGWYDVVLHPGDRARLRAMGFEVEILVDDLVAMDLADRDAERRAQAANPSERLLYRTYADYVADLHRLAAEYPALARVIALPYPTHEGRTVYAIEIADGDGADGRPGVYIDGIHHAREWPSGELPMMFAEDLVASFANGVPSIVSLLGSVRVFIVPVVNPDGFVRSRETISDFVAPLPGLAAATGEFAYHRKNMRRNSSSPVEPGQGVDCNRNYPFLWGGGGADPGSNGQTYRGPGPASEPETRNVLWLLRSHQVQTLISNHTYGNLILRPWGHTTADPPDEAILTSLGATMASHNGYSSIKGIGLYVTTGTTDDWFYAATGGIGYTFEHGSSGSLGLGNTTPVEGAGFHPQYNLHIPAFYAKNKGAYLALAEAARITAWHCIIEGTAPAGSTLTLRKSAYIPYGILHYQGNRGYAEEQEYTLVVGASGTYTWHVNPSPLPETVDAVARGARPSSALESYTLSCSAGGAQTITARRGNRYKVNF
jgi:hypothetical protein